MIGIGGVPHAEKESQQHNGEKGGHLVFYSMRPCDFKSSNISAFLESGKYTPSFRTRFSG
jgi:hypothetical protein